MGQLDNVMDVRRSIKSHIAPAIEFRMHSFVKHYEFEFQCCIEPVAADMVWIHNSESYAYVQLYVCSSIWFRRKGFSIITSRVIRREDWDLLR